MKPSLIISKVLTELIASLFIFLFVYAGISKLLDYEMFRVQLGQSPLLTKYAFFLAWFVPFLEFVIVVFLSIPKARLFGLYGAFTLMIMFSGYIIAISQFSEYIPCSCGGILQKMSWNQHLAFNLFFVLLGIVAILYHPSYGSKNLFH